MAARSASGTVTTNGKAGGKVDLTGFAPSTSPQIVIDPIAQETLLVPIIGTAPLIVHRFSEKAKKQMLDNMQGVKNPKQKKDPDAEYQGAFYRFEKGGDRFGLPVISFKAATVEASRLYDKSVTKVGLRQFLFFSGEIGYDGQMLAEIEAINPERDPHMREDVVRVGQGGTDLRYRPEWLEWRTTLQVTYIVSALTQGSVLSLIDAAGLSVGVGEWRPEKNGVNGTYRIDTDRDVEILG